MLTLLILPAIAVATVETNTGTTTQGPETLGQPSYPNSGQLRNRSNDMTGRDMSNATLMGSDEDPRVPNENPTARDDRQTRKRIPDGPYRDNTKDHHEEGPEGRQAQEAAEEGTLPDLTEKEIERKQEGY